MPPGRRDARAPALATIAGTASELEIAADRTGAPCSTIAGSWDRSPLIVAPQN
jgi:hypothetical protein